MVKQVVDAVVAFFKQEPVAVLGAVVATAGAVNEYVVANVDPSDGWKPVALAVASYFVRKSVTPFVAQESKADDFWGRAA